MRNVTFPRRSSWAQVVALSAAPLIGCECTTFGLLADGAETTGDVSGLVSTSEPESGTTFTLPTTSANATTAAESGTSLGGSGDSTTGGACEVGVNSQRYFVEESPFAVDCASGLLSTPESPGCDVASTLVEPVGGALSIHGGALMVDPTGSFTYEPPAGFFGCDGFTFEVEDALMCGGGADSLLAVAPATGGIGLDTQIALSSRGFRIAGSTVHMGDHVGNLGDINGDGFDDLAGSDGSELPASGENGVGKRVVVFGRATPILEDVTVDANNEVVGAPGLSITGIPTRIEWSPTTGIGDFNGDGFADMAVARPFGDTFGHAYIILGREDFTNFEVTQLGTKGVMHLYTPDGGEDRVGAMLTAAGDVNGDGLDDILVGTVPQPMFVNNLPVYPTYYAYIIFGRRDFASTDKSVEQILTSAGGDPKYAVLKRKSGTDWQDTLSRLGDFNGDGFDDVLLAHESQKRAYVYFGGVEWPAGLIDLDAMAPGDGVLITGKFAGKSIGLKVASADLNNDGFSDAVVASAGAFSAKNEDSAGVTYVVWGSASPPDLVDLDPILANNSTQGVAIRGVAFESSGISVSGSGDVNADGFDDLLVGAPANSDPVSSKGRAYIVLGKRSKDWDGMTLAAWLLQRSVIALNGELERGVAGASVAGGGDFNGDGFSDLIIGQFDGRGYKPEENTLADEGKGNAYVVFGGCFSDPEAVPLTVGGLFGKTTIVGTMGADRLVGGPADDTIIGLGGGDTLYGGHGDDILVISNADFDRIDGGGHGDEKVGDTLRLDSAFELDLTEIADNSVQGIERFDLGVAGASVVLAHRDLRRLSATSNTLTIDGPPGSVATVDLVGLGFMASESADYLIWDDGISTLRIHHDVSASVKN